MLICYLNLLCTESVLQSKQYTKWGNFIIKTSTIIKPQPGLEAGTSADIKKNPFSQGLGMYNPSKDSHVRV